MKQLESLQLYFENCLKTEGLYKFIPDDRKASVLKLSGAFGWLFFVSITQIYFILTKTNFENWIIAILFTPFIFVVTLILIGIYILIVKIKFNKTIDLLHYSSKIGGFYLLIFPLIVAIGTGSYLQSVTIPFYMILISLIGVFFFIIIHLQKYRFLMLLETIRSIVKVLGKSVGKIIVIVPVLLIVVLLSVFSGELWESVGNLNLLRIIGVTALIILPTALLIYASLKTTAIQITGNPLEINEIVERAKNYPLIDSNLVRGLISPEEWDDAIEELSWRSKDKLSSQLLPIVQRRIKHWLAIFLILTTTIVSLSFFVYFCVFFYVLLKPDVIAGWVKITKETQFYSINLFGNTATFAIENTLFPIIKVSVLLSVFIALASNVYALTDDSALIRLTGWLNDKAKQWLALGYFYDGLACPNYQIWDYPHIDKKRGIINVDIVVPANSTDNSVEVACNHLYNRLKSNNIIIIRAFEQNDEGIYKSWSVNKSWDFIFNKLNDTRLFTPFDNSYEEINSQHFLGIESFEGGKIIPDEWFGNNAKAILASKQVWESDENKVLVLHPYFSFINEVAFIDIRLKKRLTDSAKYREFIADILKITLEKEPSLSNITISLTFRETIDTLASFWLFKAANLITYRDEIKGESRFEKVENWVKK